MKPYVLPVAQSVPFDNTSNGFVSSNVQDAIVEAAAGSTSSYNIDKVLTDYNFDTLVDYDGNLLEGIA